MGGKRLAAVAAMFILLVAGAFALYHPAPEAPVTPEEEEEVVTPEFSEVDELLTELDEYLVFENTEYDFGMDDLLGVD
jgi:hypothetical protein